MTVIISYIDESNGTMYLGCDTAVTHSDYTKYNLKTKIQKFPELNMMIGYAGSLAPIHAVKLNLSIDSRSNDMSVYDYVCREVASPMMEILDPVLRDGDSFGALVVVEGKAFELDERGLVREILEPFHAMGSGEKVALGSLYTTRGMDLIPVEERIRIALEISSKIIFNVIEPFIVEKMDIEREVRD